MDPIPVPATAHLLVPIGTSSALANWAGDSLLRHPQTQPVLQAKFDLLVLEVKPEHRGLEDGTTFN